MAAHEKHGYEFGGPIGASLISFGLPVACYAAAFLCNDVSGSPPPSLVHPSTFSLEKLKQETGWPGFSGLISTRAVVGTLAYYSLCLVLNAVLPGQEVEGVELRGGGRLKYRFNGKHARLLPFLFISLLMILKLSHPPLSSLPWPPLGPS